MIGFVRSRGPVASCDVNKRRAGAASTAPSLCQAGGGVPGWFCEVFVKGGGFGIL